MKHKSEDKAELDPPVFASELPPLPEPAGEPLKPFRPDPGKPTGVWGDPVPQAKVEPKAEEEVVRIGRYLSDETVVRLRELCVEVTRIDKGGGVGQLATALLAELEG